MSKILENIINLNLFPLGKEGFRNECKNTLDKAGALVLPDFITQEAIQTIQSEGEQSQHLAYYTEREHNIYLSPSDNNYSKEHARNRLITSSKGCITDDQIVDDSPLRTLYNSQEFKDFLCSVLGESELHAYADPMSSINLHYASEGQELGWHFDNSSFAITLMIQNPKAGGQFEYVKDVRDADAGQMNFEESGKVLDDEIAKEILTMDPGTLVLFRGRNSMHRVTPTIGDRTRMLVVLAYNTKPDVSLSESARMTFYGRLA